jgi:hypothetical protein
MRALCLVRLAPEQCRHQYINAVFWQWSLIFACIAAVNVLYFKSAQHSPFLCMMQQHQHAALHF